MLNRQLYTIPFQNLNYGYMVNNLLTVQYSFQIYKLSYKLLTVNLVVYYTVCQLL